MKMNSECKTSLGVGTPKERKKERKKESEARREFFNK
jgi:hypothetical protein